MLAKEGGSIPKEWEHDPTIYDNEGMTVAMWYATLSYDVPI